ncbi:MAG: phage scaffolding protein, partial [Candidatus Faecalibacterium intestinavium]|nr:phage scaffolding protein [Candidatus Faecalibacterium intestinavium]
MKREDAKTHLPGITPEGLDWLMGENDADISREKARADAIQKQLDTANGQLQAAQAALKERDGQLETLRKSSGDAEALRQQIAQLQADNAAQQARQAEQLRA